ncbi:MAG: hypothetical protein V3W34_17285 [Phycisphaerae bacterium]
MAVSRMILPDYIVGSFVPPKACARCGRSDGTFTLLFPQLNWHGDEIELIYPLRCSCGGTGCVPIKLPTLLFGYILASVALVDTTNRRRSKAKMTVKPCSTDILANIFRNFDRLMETCSATPRSPALPSGVRNSIDDNDANEADRLRFGFEKNEWKKFLRRLGFDRSGAEDDQS